jgi:hypothetical protein
MAVGQSSHRQPSASSKHLSDQQSEPPEPAKEGSQCRKFREPGGKLSRPDEKSDFGEGEGSGYQEKGTRCCRAPSDEGTRFEPPSTGMDEWESAEQYPLESNEYAQKLAAMLASAARLLL